MPKPQRLPALPFARAPVTKAKDGRGGSWPVEVQQTMNDAFGFAAVFDDARSCSAL